MFLIFILDIFINGALVVIFGPEAVAVYTVYDKILNLIRSPTSGSTRGLLSVTGHLYGAGKIKKVKSLFYHGLKVNLLIALITAAIFYIFHFLILMFYDLGIFTYYADVLGSSAFNLIFIVLCVMVLCLSVSYSSSKV